MKWFGESWGAPVCELSDRGEIPIGMACMHCGDVFTEQSQGLTLPAFELNPLRVSEVSSHLDCFLRACGARGI